jgi:predicted RNA-binding protein YlqC (UPF0109 family)
METPNEEAINYLKVLLEGFCHHPEEITYEVKADEFGWTIVIVPGKTDVNNVIGPEGSVIWAVRRLMMMWGLKHQCRFNVYVPNPKMK